MEKFNVEKARLARSMRREERQRLTPVDRTLHITSSERYEATMTNEALGESKTDTTTSLMREKARHGTASLGATLAASSRTVRGAP